MEQQQVISSIERVIGIIDGMEQTIYTQHAMEALVTIQPMIADGRINALGLVGYLGGVKDMLHRGSDPSTRPWAWHALTGIQDVLNAEVFGQS